VRRCPWLKLPMRPVVQFRRFRHRLEMANVRQRFLFSEPEMKQKTRDNLIYLAVGLSIVALIVVDLFFADGHGQKMWWPSKFASRVAYTTALLAYFVARETRRVKATVAQVFACVLFASVVNLAIGYGFHQAIDRLPGITFAAWAVLEIFVLVQLLVQLVLRL
jgi:hypothetical protein